MVSKVWSGDLISFVVPFRSDDPYRIESADFVSQRLFDDWHPVASFWSGASDIVGPFNRSASRNYGAQQVSGDVLVFVDADSDVPGEQMVRALDHVVSNGGWAFPYTRYCSLTQTGSQRYMDGEYPVPEDYAYVFPSAKTPEPSVGGCVITTREAFETVGGYDERFIAWGEEDRAFALSLQTLVGEPSQVVGPLYHLWHPAPEDVRFEHPHFMDNRLLCNRYREAYGNQQMMEQLVAERR
jgi:hypothetical protein